MGVRPVKSCCWNPSQDGKMETDIDQGGEPCDSPKRLLKKDRVSFQHCRCPKMLYLLGKNKVAWIGLLEFFLSKAGRTSNEE